MCTGFTIRGLHVFPTHRWSKSKPSLIHGRRFVQDFFVENLIDRSKPAFLVLEWFWSTFVGSHMRCPYCLLQYHFSLRESRGGSPQPLRNWSPPKRRQKWWVRTVAASTASWCLVGLETTGSGCWLVDLIQSNLRPWSNREGTESHSGSRCCGPGMANR